MLDGGKGGRKLGTTWPEWNLWHEIMGVDFCGVGRSGRSFRINLQARGVLRVDHHRVFGVQKRPRGKMGAGITPTTEQELGCVNHRHIPGLPSLFHSLDQAASGKASPCQMALLSHSGCYWQTRPSLGVDRGISFPAMWAFLYNHWQHGGWLLLARVRDGLRRRGTE